MAFLGAATNSRSSRRDRSLLLAGECLVLLLAWGASMAVWASREGQPFGFAFLSTHLRYTVIMPALWLILAASNGLYSERVAGDVRAVSRGLLKVVGGSLVCYFLIYFFARPGSAPRQTVLAFALVAIVLTGGIRGLYIAMAQVTQFRRRAVVIGAEAEAAHAVQVVRRYLGDEYDLIGVMDPDGRGLGEYVGGLRVLGGIEDLLSVVRKHRISEVIVCGGPARDRRSMSQLLDCYQQGVAVIPVESLYADLPPYARPASAPLSAVSEFPGQPRRRGGAAQVLRQSFDAATALVSLISFGVLFPVLLTLVYLYSRWAELSGSRRGPVQPSVWQ